MASTDTSAIKLYKNSDSDKRVGINILKTTNSLSYNLQVNGTANISGALSAGSLSLTTALPVNQGGTGATTAANARTNLGIGASGTHADSYFALAGHNHEIQNLTNYSSRVYDATISRTKNTVLAAPNGSAGAASFRALVVADLPTGTTSSTVSLGNHTHSYAGSSSAGGAASSSIKFQAYEGTSSSNRLTTADQDPDNGYCIWFHATSSMSTNKPPKDGHILHFAWDNSSPAWASQLFVSDGNNNIAVATRGRDSSSWGSWQPLIVCSKINNSSYWGMSINGSEDDWIRAPKPGIIPAIAGGSGAGQGSLGTSSFYWSKAYVDNIYGKLNGNATGLVDALNSSKTITAQYSGSGLASTSWFCVWNGYRIDPMDASHMRSSLGLITTSPTTGIGTTETTVTSDADVFSAFIASGVPGNSATSTCFVPKSTITSTAQEWQLTDEAHYIVFSLRISGSTLYAKVLRTNNGTKTISVAGLRGA